MNPGVEKRAAAVLTAAFLLVGCSRDNQTSGGPPAVKEAAEVKATDTFGRIPEVVRQTEPSVVTVLTDKGEGSGVVWRKDGLVLTNHHVIDAARSVELAFADGKRIPAHVLGTDPLTDLALLKSSRADLPELPFAKGLPAVGELAVAIGSPLGFANTVTAGIISGLHRDIPGAAALAPALVDLVQTDAPISPGNSGGALINRDGTVVGINVAYIPPQAAAESIGFAIPAPRATEVATQLLEKGTVRHPFIGLQLAPLTPDISRRLQVGSDTGVLVLDVIGGGPADKAGLGPGDVIVRAGGQRVDTVEAFLGVMRNHRPGDVLELEVVRGAQRLTVNVTLGEQPVR